MKTRISMARAYQVSDQRGSIYADWKKDLAEEEGDDYLPAGYSYRKVLELSYIEANTIGKGHGAELMREFLASPAAHKAELIFLDPNPYMGAFRNSRVPGSDQIARLQKFYRQFGFRNNPPVGQSVARSQRHY